MLGVNTYSPVSCPKVALLVTFLVLWILAETVPKDPVRQPRTHPDNFGFAASDLAKAVLSLSIWFIGQQLRGVDSLWPTIARAVALCSSTEVHLGLPISNVPLHAHPRSNTANLTLGSLRSTLSILAVGLIYALRAYTNIKAREFVDPFTLYLAFPVTILVILSILRVVSWRTFSSAFWHACALQFAGFFITRDALVSSVHSDLSLLVAFALCNALWISLVDLIYGLHRSSSVSLINTVIFAQSSLLHYLLYLSQPSPTLSGSYHDRLAFSLQVLPAIEAAKDIVMMFIIQQYSALNQGILISLASTFLMTVDTWRLIQAPYSAYLGCLIAILGFGIFVHELCDQHIAEQQHDLLVSTRRYVAAAMVSLAALAYIVAVVFQDPGTRWRPLFGLSSRRAACGVQESPPLIHGQTVANYSHFDNVLLVVFFSHPRYNANLDFHREVYGDYFPNIIYIGPASREDKGFAHSYDVLVDSFQSEEDLSDLLFYKMAGRMAHHMLYTALRDYDCYDGYLWVPFDTLINIPRLQQFDQSLFWYHSPWGQPVPNIALGNVTEPELDISRHAPPAMISPDTSINLTETWRGWGPDWWWGDPHVGVSVCMNAFREVPEDMRAHLAERTHGQTRLMGGSADTLYIPGRHRKAFMDILALFLETNCFLEIATPTTVHLVVPPGESIQFVDHWWIYQPPLNASFVRQKWAEGYEVDTFHTFHWGERGEDGIWRGDHRHVADVRHLLWESANRQGLGDVFPVNLGADVRLAGSDIGS